MDKHLWIGTHYLIGLHQHGITTQDRGVRIPLLMHGRLSSTQWRSIHDVIMHQGEVVEEFDTDRFIQHIRCFATEKFAAMTVSTGRTRLAGRPRR